MIASIKLILISYNYDLSKMKVALIDGRLPEKEFESPETIYQLHYEMTHTDRVWIPLLKKINFFIQENKMIGVYAIVVSDEPPLVKGEWFPIAHSNLPKEDFEIFQVAVNMI